MKKICECGSDKVDVFSCKEVKVSVVEITYMCRECGMSKSEMHFLYKRK